MSSVQWHVTISRLDNLTESLKINNLNCNKIVVGRCRVKFYTNSDDHAQFDCMVECVQINKNICFNICSTSTCLTVNTATDLEFSSCATVDTATTLEFLKLWHAENENTNKNCDCAMHCSRALEELNSKSHLQWLAKCSNQKEQTCQTNKFSTDRH